MPPGNRVGARLSRLIKAKAYLEGNRLVLEKRIEELKAELSAARHELKRMQADTLDVEAQITGLSEIDPKDIRPIRNYHRKSDQKYGQFRCALIALLQSANGPITTDALLIQMAERMKLSLSTPADMKRARSQIRRPLALFAKRGAVMRLPTEEGERYGNWLWIGY